MRDIFQFCAWQGMKTSNASAQSRDSELDLGMYLPAQDKLVHEAVAGHEAEHAVRHHLAHLQDGLANGVLP